MKAIFLFIFLCMQCKNGKQPDEAVPYTPSIQINQLKLKKEVLETGDIQAYESLYNQYLASPIPQELLFYSLYMADRYGYVQANYDIYINIVLLCKYNKKALSEDMAKLAIEKLLKASELCHGQAMDKVNDYKINKNSNVLKVFKELLEN